MELLSEILVRKTSRSRLHETDFENLAFGKDVADHMLVADYHNGQWQHPTIVPYSNLSLSPATLALHYGQTVFEGIKAFRMPGGGVNIFRLDRHYDRFAKSLDRMCMAVPSREIFIDGIVKLIETDHAWVPDKPGAALYIRPFMYASEAKFGIKISEQYRFIVFSGPVPELYAEPISVKVETAYIRAAKGGTGFVKCGGNYGGALYPTQLAKKQGYDQILWTDARENKYIEESGMMNVMFVINDTIVTPPISDSILDGITRGSLLTLAMELGYKTSERPVSVEELEYAFRHKEVTEAFGAGTAAVIAPIRVIHINGIDYKLPEYNSSSISRVLKDNLEKIRTGESADKFGWNFII